MTKILQIDREAAEEWRYILRDSTQYEGDAVADLSTDFASHREQATAELAVHVAALADSLEAELRDRYGYLLKEPMHKDSQRRFDREMQEVYAARSALTKANPDA